MTNYWVFPDTMSEAERTEWLANWKADQKAQEADAEHRAKTEK